MKNEILEVKLISGEVLNIAEYKNFDGHVVEFRADYVAENGTEYKRKYMVPLTSIAYIKSVVEMEKKNKGDKK